MGITVGVGWALTSKSINILVDSQKAITAMAPTLQEMGNVDTAECRAFTDNDEMLEHNLSECITFSRMGYIPQLSMLQLKRHWAAGVKINQVFYQIH